MLLLALNQALERQARHQRDGTQRQVTQAAEIGRTAAAAKRRGAHRKQREADGRDHHGSHDRRDNPAPVLREQAKHAFDAAAHDDGTRGRAHAVCGHHARHNGNEREADAHDDGQSAAQAPDGEQLDKRADACNEHGRLNHPARFRIAKAGHAGNDHDRRQVRHEHGQDVLDAIGHRAQNRYVAVEFQQLIMVERLQMRAHRRNSISPVSGSIACTMASDSR